MNQCKFCNKYCSNKYILNNHIKKSKKCLKIQEYLSIFDPTCKWCHGTFEPHDYMKIHLVECKHKKCLELNILLKKKEDEIIYLKMLLHEKNVQLSPTESEKLFHNYFTTNINLPLIDEVIQNDFKTQEYYTNKHKIRQIFGFIYEFYNKIIDIHIIHMCHIISKYNFKDNIRENNYALEFNYIIKYSLVEYLVEMQNILITQAEHSKKMKATQILTTKELIEVDRTINQLTFLIDELYNIYKCATKI